MAGLEDLYQDLIVDHSRSPRNFRKLEAPTHTAQGHNPLCGDQLTLYVTVQDGVIEDVAFQGQGCAISKASASLMTSALKGKTLEDADRLFDSFHALLTEDAPAVDVDSLGKLAALGGVRQFPIRIKCATLAWHTLQAALQGRTAATTE